MTQRRRNRHRKRRVGRRAFLIGLGGSVSAALTYYLLRSIPAGNNAESVPSPQAAPNPALPRAESTALYFGLGAYRVGVGDGGANADSVSQWCTGSALARQVTDLRSAGAGGWALYRYGSLFRSDESGLAAAERAALTALDG